MRSLTRPGVPTIIVVARRTPYSIRNSEFTNREALTPGAAMNFTIVLPLLLAIAQGESESAKAQREWLFKLHLGDALEYTIYRDASRKEKLEFRKEPVYVWTNPVRASQQDGVVFVWTSRGRPEAIGTIFSSAGGGKRGVTHEFHSLSLGSLDVARRGTHDNLWKPKGPGIALAPIEGAPSPRRSAAQRLAQMRTLARDFSAATHDAEDHRWELRLLSQPLYRYESTDPDVLDGALFAFVTSAGTDPEALLVIEARQPAGGGVPVWYRALARFTDLDLSVRYKGKEVFSAARSAGTSFSCTRSRNTGSSPTASSQISLVL